MPVYMAQCTVQRAKTSSLDTAGTVKLWDLTFLILFVVSRQTFANPLSTLVQSPEEKQQFLRLLEKGTAYSLCMRFELLSSLTAGKLYKRWVLSS